MYTSSRKILFVLPYIDKLYLAGVYIDFTHEITSKVSITYNFVKVILISVSCHVNLFRFLGLSSWYFVLFCFVLFCFFFSTSHRVNHFFQRNDILLYCELKIQFMEVDLWYGKWLLKSVICLYHIQFHRSLSSFHLK